MVGTSRSAGVTKQNKAVDGVIKIVILWRAGSLASPVGSSNAYSSLNPAACGDYVVRFRRDKVVHFRRGRVAHFHRDKVVHFHRDKVAMSLQQSESDEVVALQ
jgi:hypothetical protein